MISDRSRRIWLLAGGVGILVIAALAILHLTSSTASYNGKTLEQWIQLMDSQNPSVQKQAIDSVRSIGTNAIPFLIQWMAHRDTESERRFHRWVTGKTPVSVWPMLLRNSENNQEYRALLGFFALGSEARPALPALERLVRTEDPCNPAKPQNAAQAYVYVDASGAERLAEQWGSSTNHETITAGTRLRSALARVQAVSP